MTRDRHRPFTPEPASGPVIPLLPGGIDPLAAPDPSWLATASPEDIRAEMFCRAMLSALAREVSLIPRNPAELEAGI